MTVGEAEGPTSGRVGRLFRDTVIYGLGRYLSAFAGLLLLPLFTRALPPEQYGAVDLITTIGATLGVFAVLGTDSSLTMVYFDGKDSQERVSAATTALWIRGGMAILLAAALALGAPWVTGILFGNASYGLLVMVAAAAFPFQQMAAFGLDYLRLRMQPIPYMMVSLLQLAINLGVGTWLVLVEHVGPLGLVGASAAANVAGALLSLVLVRGGLSGGPTRTMARRMLGLGLPIVPASIALFLTSYSDRYFISHFLSLQDIGLYSVGLKIASILGLATSSLQLAWGPFAFSIKDQADANQVYARVLRLYTVVAMGGAIVLAAFSREILWLLASNRYAGAGPAASLLVLVPVLTGAYYIVSIGVNLAAKTAYLSLTTGIAAVVSLAANATLVGRFHLPGAATAAILANLASVVALYRYSQRFRFIPYEWQKVSLAALAGLVILWACTLAQQLPASGAIWLRLALVLLYLLLVRAIGLVTREDIVLLRALFARFGRAGDASR